MEPASKKERSYLRPVLAGMITGQIASLILVAVFMLVFTVFLGKNPLYPIQVFGAALLGKSALQGVQPLAIIIGIVFFQAGPSLLLGVTFGILASKLSISTSLASLILGLIIAVISISGHYVLLPTLMIGLHGVDLWGQEIPKLWDWVAHFAYGLSFVLYPFILKKT